MIHDKHSHTAIKEIADVSGVCRCDENTTLCSGCGSGGEKSERSESDRWEGADEKDTSGRNAIVSRTRRRCQGW